jgi:hypothetical protein
MQDYLSSVCEDMGTDTAVRRTCGIGDMLHLEPRSLRTACRIGLRVLRPKSRVKIKIAFHPAAAGARPSEIRFRNSDWRLKCKPLSQLHYIVSTLCTFSQQIHHRLILIFLCSPSFQSRVLPKPIATTVCQQTCSLSKLRCSFLQPFQPRLLPTPKSKCSRTFSLCPKMSPTRLHGVQGITDTIIQTVGITNPVYLSVDIDVIDPSICTGTGTPSRGAGQLANFVKFFVGSSLFVLSEGTFLRSPRLMITLGKRPHWPLRT